MVHKFLTATFATIWNNFVTLFRLIDYRTVLTCLLLTIVLWPLIRFGFVRPTKQVLEIVQVVVTGAIYFWLNCAFCMDASFIFALGCGVYGHHHVSRNPFHRFR